jgi:cyanophycinase-like exopeptidase
MVRLLAIMGSGETAPTMVKPHRSLFAALGDAPAVMLDTPYGFQENADDISARAVTYFQASVGRAVDVVSWRRREQPPADRERAIATLGAAGWIFAGPGSPTYALRQWRDTALPRMFADRLRAGGVVVFASAAALTLGSHTVPVYEIYKAGEDPSWEPGLDLIREATGLPAVVIPHYDNAEGGHHDTRYCYLGERRLARMERELPPETFILGVDEHTMVSLDLDAQTVTVVGNGTMTIRRAGRSTVFEAGEVLTFAQLADPTLVTAAGPAPVAAEPPSAPDQEHGISPLRRDTDRLAAACRDATDADTCVDAILELEHILVDWASDTSDDAEHARATVRQMIVTLGGLAKSSEPHGDALDAAMRVILDLRAAARAAKDYATSDRIRDTLAEVAIEIRDTPTGAEWLRRA